MSGYTGDAGLWDGRTVGDGVLGAYFGRRVVLLRLPAGTWRTEDGGSPSDIRDIQPKQIWRNAMTDSRRGVVGRPSVIGQVAQTLSTSASPLGTTSYSRKCIVPGDIYRGFFLFLFGTTCTHLPVRTYLGNGIDGQGHQLELDETRPSA